MNPILFAKNSTTFTTNGIGRLSDAVSCTVSEIINGEYELEMKYPIDGVFYSEIGMNSIIVSRHEDSDDMQPFEVYKISKPRNGIVTINAHHISYRLSNCVTMPFSISASASACNNTLQGLKSHAAVSNDVSLFTFWTNVSTAGSYNQTTPASIKSRLGGVEGSVLDQFGGEYEWDGFTVKLHNQRGSANTGFILRYGKNITDINQEEEISNVVTGVVPFWTNMDKTDSRILTEKVVYSPYVNNYPYHLTVPLDLSDKWEDKPSESTLRSAAQAWVNKSSLGVPKVNITLSFVALWQTEEYKDIAPLERVHMGDAVKVYFEKLGIEAQARVMGTEYNVLLERYDEIQIGSIRSTLAQTLNDQNAKTIQTVEATKQQAAQYTDEVVNNATAWLTSAGGYVVAVKNQDGSWKELLFVNHSDPSQATQGIRINNNGIGFWNKNKDGGNMWSGPYTNAWTIDGHLIADFIHGGTLTLGGNNNGNGWLKIVGADGSTVIGKWDKDGINVKSGSLTLGGKNGRDDANDGVYVGSNGIGLGANSPFKVTNAGALTATGVDITGAIKAISGEIGSGNSKFTITGNHIANGKGSLTDSNNGVYVGTDGIALGQNSKFKVDNQGALNASNASINGTIVSAANNYSVAIQNGKIHCETPDASSNDSIKITSGSYDELSIGIDDFYIEYEEDEERHHEEVAWHDIYSLVSNYKEHGGWW